MQHFPIFLDTQNTRILLSGGGEAAIAKLRLLLKTQARIEVFAPDAAPEIIQWAADGRLVLHDRPLAAPDAEGARLVYAADEDPAQDARTAGLGRAAGALVNIVDNLQDSTFITPAIVDRDPVTVAIGTEGAAPVLARKIKSDLEASLPTTLGPLARIGKAFRKLAEALPHGAPRRAFWAAYYFKSGPRAFAASGTEGAEQALDDLLTRHLAAAGPEGHVDFIGAGPGDPELLTLKARNALDRADVVIHDRLVSPAILELARREAVLIDAGKTGFGKSMAQDAINGLIVDHAQAGAHVVRLKGGDPTVFGRLDEEVDALAPHGISYAVIPGITAASASAAALGRSLTRRGRNTALRLVTAHDMQGYADQDWRSLAQPGEVTAIYMGKRAARFVQGRLLMHGAAPDTPVSVVWNASLPEQRVASTTLAQLVPTVTDTTSGGPALILIGLSPSGTASIRFPYAFHTPSISSQEAL